MKKIRLTALLVFLMAVPFTSLALANSPEPEITIRQEADRTIEEYRVNGQLYAIKIIPKVGEPYYLVDSEGDGQLDKRQERGRLLIPSWILFKW
ncbi:DUF2782 domain-containing protein [Marinospirillum insulare]|uniref:DUF2782 domain-containing protein n=1 Tax=Marinospirillum insulare TaxID=217169 RepID=A0ABQ5ZUW3_9GAMM|nr:DUF2782 domain-containing protein [Marinospirillum insulare]GLR63251.1 hypothetical protein GCM10007878_06860 [Marinospirillum insulare]